MAVDPKFAALWEEIKKQLKEIEFDLPLYRALEAAVPIALDGTHVVIGFDAHHAADGNYLSAPKLQATIERVLSKVATKPLKLVIIDGTSTTDYEHFKERHAAAERRRQQADLAARERAQAMAGEPLVEPTEEGSDSAAARVVVEYGRLFHGLWREFPNRNKATARAQFLFNCLPGLAEAEVRIEAAAANDYQVTRHLSRLIERLADLVETDATIVALELTRYKREQGISED